MSFSLTEKKELLCQIRRIQEQFDGVERAIGQERSCTHLLQLIAAARHAVDGFFVSVIKHHLRSHLVEEGVDHSEAVKDTIKMAQLYLHNPTDIDA
jgi:DNA-binding FrmR family transcriptional regulator